MTEETSFPDLDKINNQPIDDKYRVAKDLFAGTIGGITQVLVGQPFDTTKVRLQSDTTGQYKNTLDVVKKLISNEGPQGFYKGTLTPLIGVGACVSIQFGVNEYMKRNVFSDFKILSNSQYYQSGLVAGVANSILASPIEHIRIRLQTQLKGNLGPLDIIKNIYKSNGVSGLMKGFIPTAIREGHGMGMYFLTFEYLVKQDILKNKVERKDIPGWKLCLYGAGAGYSMWFSVYPIDVIKSRLQTDSLNKPIYKNMFHVTSTIWKTQGLKGFFKGFIPTILRAAPANAATFYAFELTIRLLG
ncbi:Calcium-binding mitochondrial carrier protein [Wickerhamomyces ciferrii]|uniref:Calcium-binding mitochondrial carrier protein n=1 Tax=Wickerhamomyces ciferrii (strain ATCC 14091 / BCRC 22168 / CBS 111 / JCM 3599 / NBRC 0793 / NRRL Y-1031 F-60-10) TaxID=1206466 RepID=K0KS03_WICCF|nr:Calcium-binding mitochondrial carrier protein [Wickerhamomyces ciferrii]CCH44114.1 Calcium-binding mitochondrial carrier protein [Wickerhamomyces ciferrii]